MDGQKLSCGGQISQKQDEEIMKNMEQLSKENQKIQTNSKDKKSINQQLQKQPKVQDKKCCKQQKCLQACKKLINVKQQQEKQNKQKLQKIVQKDNQQQKKQKATLCKKCKLNDSALLHKNDPICKDCLFKNIQYKCRLTLENSMNVKSESSILICFSGGLNSICLVNIMANLKRRYQKHHLFGQVRCLHIKQQQNIPQGYVAHFQNVTGLKLEVIQIGQIFESLNQKKNYSHHQALEQIKKIFTMFNTAANTLDLLTLFRDKLIVQYAKKHNFQFTVKGLNGERIATEIFKYFAKGIGGDITELASREPDSLFYFPLRQHLQKQLQYYFHSLKCSQISLKSQNDDLSNFCKESMDTHLTNFLGDLQTMYSHTAPAITRTGQKIESNRINDIRCRWCMLKGSHAPKMLCRKCQRIYEYRNKDFSIKNLPIWMQFQE